MDNLEELKDQIKSEIAELDKSKIDLMYCLPISDFEKNNEIFKLYRNCKLRSMEGHRATLCDILQCVR